MADSQTMPPVAVRTPEEIAERVRKIAHDDFFGFQQDVLLSYLPVEALREFTKPDADLSDWTPLPLHAEPIAQEVRDYMAFAWGKVEDHRGISAKRSVQKISTWLWVLGMDGVVADMDAADYAQYGAPKLAVACRALGLPIPDGEGVGRMIQGLPCESDCEEGCG